MVMYYNAKLSTCLKRSMGPEMSGKKVFTYRTEDKRGTKREAGTGNRRKRSVYRKECLWKKVY